MPHVRIFIVLMQLLVVSHAPMPWAHDHAELSQEQLRCHLRMCHADSPHDEIPHGRHVHFTVPDAIVDGTTDSRSISDVAPIEKLSVDFDVTLARSMSGLDPAIDAMPRLVRPAGYYLSCRAAASGCKLFQVFGAVRI